CLRTQNGTCSNEDGGDLQSLDPLITSPDLRSDTAQRAGARLAVALRTPTSSRQGARDTAWRWPGLRLTLLGSPLRGQEGATRGVRRQEGIVRSSKPAARLYESEHYRPIKGKFRDAN